MSSKFVRLSYRRVINTDHIVWFLTYEHGDYAARLQLIGEREPLSLNAVDLAALEKHLFGGKEDGEGDPDALNAEFRDLQPGLYRIYWKSGGHSLASVGVLHDGSRWYAPCNWTSDPEAKAVCDNDWSIVERVQRIDPSTDGQPKSEFRPPPGLYQFSGFVKE